MGSAPPGLTKLSEDLLLDPTTIHYESITGNREIGGDAVWTISSAKPRFDVEQIRDNNLETYWQSDGPSPHYINIQFNKRMTVEEVAIYTNFATDESYTPCQIAIKGGTTLHDLQDIKTWEFNEPHGWLIFLLSSASPFPVRANFIQIVILANHQSGRDTHIRQVKIFGPRENMGPSSGTFNFESPELFIYNCIR